MDDPLDIDPHNITGKYVLIGQTPVPEPDLMKWARWCETNERHVNRTQVGPYDVSTVFLGLDHNWSHKGPPLLFQTMVFESREHGRDSIEQDRCSTWNEAEEMHARMVQRIQEKCAAVSD